MSTRSIIRVRNIYGEVKIYHHCDGYPEGVGFDLMDRFADSFENFKKLDMKATVANVANELVKDSGDRYEITISNHVDIEYEYIIDCDLCKIWCFEIDKDWKTGLTMSRSMVDLEKLYEQAKSGEKAND